MADGKGCTCLAYNSSECACNADWTPQEIYDLRRALRESAEAICAAMPYVAPLASKNSRKGDEALAVMSRMVRGVTLAQHLKVVPEIRSNYSNNGETK